MRLITKKYKHDMINNAFALLASLNPQIQTDQPNLSMSAHTRSYPEYLDKEGFKTVKARVNNSSRSLLIDSFNDQMYITAKEACVFVRPLPFDEALSKGVTHEENSVFSTLTHEFEAEYIASLARQFPGQVLQTTRSKSHLNGSTLHGITCICKGNIRNLILSATSLPCFEHGTLHSYFNQSISDDYCGISHAESPVNPWNTPYITEPAVAENCKPNVSFVHLNNIIKNAAQAGDFSAIITRLYDFVLQDGFATSCSKNNVCLCFRPKDFEISIDYTQINDSDPNTNSAKSLFMKLFKSVGL
jgi:hypothetical protein